MPQPKPTPRSRPAQDKTVKEVVAELRRGVNLLDQLVQRPPPAPPPVGTTFTLAAGLPSDKPVFRIVARGPVDQTTTVALSDGTTSVTLTEVKRDARELIAEANLSALSTGTWETTLTHDNKVQLTTTTEVL
jgi:Mg-chelatase subunit ChlD